MLILTQDLALAGAQRQAVELAAGLKERGCDVRVGVIHPGGPLTSELQQLGIPITEFPRRWRWDLSPIAGLIRYLRRERIQVIHSLLFLPNFYARLSGRLARTPAIVSSLRNIGIQGWLRYALDIATCRLCHANIANCEAGRTHYLRRGGSRQRTVVIRNGLRWHAAPLRLQPDRSLRAEWGLERFKYVIGMVGAMERRKDQGLLLRSLARVVKIEAGVGLLLIGTGSRRSAIQAQAAALGLESHVVCTGELAPAWPAYPLMDVYTHASAAEGISNSILEAMASGLAVVANDVGGNREVITHGKTGYLVPRHDASAMASAILCLLQNPSLRRAMGAAAARRTRTDFSVDRLVGETQALYDRILS